MSDGKCRIWQWLTNCWNITGV